MKKTLALAGLLVLSAFGRIEAATITGTIVDNTGNPLTNGVIRFLPNNNPGSVSASVVAGIQKTANLTTNGTFSVTLLTGNYTVTANGYEFCISVPGGSDTIDVTDILCGGATSFPFHAISKVSSDDTTPGFLSTKLLEGQGISLTVLTNGGNERLAIAVADSIYTNSSAGKLNRASDNATNITFAGTNTFLATNATVALSMEEELILVGQDFRRFGKSWTNAMARMADGDTLIINGETIELDSVEVTKDINIIGVNGGTLKHADNATGHMLKWTVPWTGYIKGLKFDGNVANQTTNNFYALLYPYSNGGRIEDCEFNGWVRSAIVDFQSVGPLYVERNRFFNGMQLETNTPLSNSALFFAPGITNTRPHLVFRNNILTNSSTKTGRYSGGVYTAAANSTDSLNSALIADNYFNYVGDDTGIGLAHYGVAAIDVYEDNNNVVVRNNIITNTYFTGIKLQNTQNGLVEGNSVHTFDSQAIGIQHGERFQTNSYWNTIIRNNFLYGNGATTYGIHLSPGDSGTNIANVLIDGNFITNCIRGINMYGLSSLTDLQVSSFGPVRIINNFIASTNNNAIMGTATMGDIDILFNTIINEGVGSGISFVQTNETTNLRIIGNTISGASWGVRAWGVNSIVASGNTVYGGLESVEIQADTDANQIQKLYWHKDNIIRGGSVDVVAADVVAGYFGNGNDITWYPNQNIETTTGAAGSYFRELHLDGASSSLLFRARNDDPAGAAVMSIRAGGPSDVVAQFSAYATNFADADKAGWVLFAAENAPGTSGITISAPYTNKSVRIRAGDFTTRFAVNFGGANFPQLTASRALVLDANQNAAASAVTSTELGYLSGATGNIQTNLDNHVHDAADITSGNLEIARFNAGTGAGATTYWRGDGTWATPPGSSGTVGTMINSGTPLQYAIPMYNDTTGTNMVPTGLKSDATGTNFYVGALYINDLVVSNSFTAPSISVDTEVYGAGWDADLTVPTKDAVYDKIETLVAASGDEVLINGAAMTNPNFKDGTNSVIWAVGDSTNVFGFPTNILSSQILDGTIDQADIAADAFTSAELADKISDESGSGVFLRQSGNGLSLTASTPSAGDDGVRVATTAWVQDELDATRAGSHASPDSTNPSAPTWAGPLHVFYAGGTMEIDLPAAAGYDGRAILIYNTGAFTITIDPNGTEVIVREGTVQSGGVSMTLSSGAGNYVALICDGTRWITLGKQGTLAVGT